MKRLATTVKKSNNMKLNLIKIDSQGTSTPCKEVKFNDNDFITVNLKENWSFESKSSFSRTSLSPLASSNFGNIKEVENDKFKLKLKKSSRARTNSKSPILNRVKECK